MPIATIKTYKGALSDEQKRQIHREFADMMVRIEGKGNEDFRKLVILSIEEEDTVNMSLGGQVATKEFVKAVTRS